MFMPPLLLSGISTNRITLFTLPTLLLLFGFFISAGAGTALAVSPMPSEIENDQGKKSIEQLKQNSVVCKIKIVYINGKPRREDYVSSIAIEAATSWKDALEKSIKYFEDKLRDEDISTVAVDCKFPAFGQTE